jgi:zinc protease
MAKPADVAGTFFVREKGGIREYKLGANDLQILLAPDPSVPVAGCMVTYRVGSRNEAVGHTGSTHLLEHLMFKGSDKFNKETGGTIWQLLEKKGAVLNATTDFDRTNYYAVVPKEALPVSIAIEADRMRHAHLVESDRASEMTVVRNEYEWLENQPFDPLTKQLWALAYQAHPYHHPVIGWRSDIENVSIERLKAFYDEFYWPNNATVTIVGDFDEKEVLGMLVEGFGGHPRAPKPIPSMHTIEPPQEGERRAVVRRAADANLVGVAYKTPEGLSADIPALLVAALILGEGKTSRLHKALVDTAITKDATILYQILRDPSLFMAVATLAGDSTHEYVEKLIKAEFSKLAKTPPSAAEMQVAKRLYRSALASRRDGPYALLSSINEDIAQGDWTLFFTFPEAIEKVAPRDVSRVVRRYLTDDAQSTVAYFIGTNAKKAPTAQKPKKVKNMRVRRRPAFRIPRASRRGARKPARPNKR